MRAFNDRLARLITRAVGTMWCAYAFALLSLVSLPSVLRTGDPVQIVAWVAQTFLQLVLLSVILVGQRLAAEPLADLAAAHVEHRAHLGLALDMLEHLHRKVDAR